MPTKRRQTARERRLALRERRAAFLMRWFLDVYDNRRAPYPAKSFRSVAHGMRDFVSKAPAGGRVPHFV